MKFKIRLVIILVVYLLLVFMGLLVENRLEGELGPAIFENPSISVYSFLDDFIRVRVSCYWENKSVNFLVFDDLNNLRHNSTLLLSCNGYKEVDLQGQPQDYTRNNQYRVQLKYDDQTITSNYFYLRNNSKSDFIKKEAFSFFYFMFYQSRLARGSYSDSQRLLYVQTKDPVYAERFFKVHSLGIISTFTIFFTIDIAIWIFIFIKRNLSKGRR